MSTRPKNNTAVIVLLKEQDSISAANYKKLMDVMFRNSKKKDICEKLRISRVTHDYRLNHGVNRRKQVLILRKIVETEVTALRARARAIDSWTTTNRIHKPIPRLTYDKRSG